MSTPPPDLALLQPSGLRYNTRVQQEMWCRAIRQDTADVGEEVEWLGKPGGWFSVRALQKLLVPERQMNWERALKKMPQTDVGLLSPRLLALDVLSRIVPNPPVSQSKHLFSAEAEAKIWNDWIAAHQAELSKLEPTGEGVDFSDKACTRDGKPATKQ